jgi:hypothetical protein
MAEMGGYLRQNQVLKVQRENGFERAQSSAMGSDGFMISLKGNIPGRNHL